MDDDQHLMSAQVENEAESAGETSLRPQWLADYIGQEQIKESFPFIFKLPAVVKKRWTTCCYMDRLD